MPTGYTADIPKGITFQQYAMNCARAFGALILMRDEPSDAPIPDEFAPSDFHLKRIETLDAELRRIMAMSDDDCESEALKEYKEAEARRLERLAENTAMLQSYRSMLEEVKAWEPPSDDHVEMKSFMIDQIVKSIEWDDSSDYLQAAHVRHSGFTWKTQRIKTLAEDIERSLSEQAKEEERTAGRNRWVKQLRESLESAA